MSPTPSARRLRLGLPRRVFSQVLLMQVAIAAGVAVLVTGLFLAPLSQQLDDQAMRRALAIAQTTAAQPQLAEDLVSTRPSVDGPVQAEAERIRKASGAEYVVVMNMDGVRWSHTDPKQIGGVVSTDPRQALAGQAVMQIDDGTLGRSARGKVPLRDADGKIVGAVSVGIEYDNVRARLIHAIPGLFAYVGAALAIGSLVAYLISRRVQRQTRDLAFSDISSLLAEREAMLHGIREGVVALDRGGRVRLLNDEAQRLLGTGEEAVGRSPDEALGEGRTTDVLAGRVTGTDLLTVQGQRVLVTNRMPTDDGGAVATLRDRTELEQLGRELDSTRGLIDALRAQDHEHANRMHTLLGLLELEMYDDAVEFVGEVVGDHRATSEQVTEKIHDPLLAAVLVGKAAVAAERGMALSLSNRTLLPDRLIDPRGLVTVVGNLVDNALDAVAGTPHARVEVELRSEGRTAVLRVRDTGPGVPVEQRELVFTDGWSTKRPPAHGKRGIGLSLVRRLTERQGGSARVTEADGGGAEFVVVLPEALTEPGLTDPGPTGMGSAGPETARHGTDNAGMDRPGSADPRTTHPASAAHEPAGRASAAQIPAHPLLSPGDKPDSGDPLVLHS